MRCAGTVQTAFPKSISLYSAFSASEDREAVRMQNSIASAAEDCRARGAAMKTGRSS